jgi:DNA phosphorothioation-dependent restriction protein DptG
MTIFEFMIANTDYWTAQRLRLVERMSDDLSHSLRHDISDWYRTGSRSGDSV